jgi:hypothetical protein
MGRSPAELVTKIVREEMRKERYGTIKTTPERIVRDYRNNVGPMVPVIKKETSLLERIIKIFLLIALGWGIGYFHHFFAG